MKTKELVFKKPVRIVQVFYHIHLFSKEAKAAPEAKPSLQENGIQSYSGYVANNELFLPENITNNPSFSNCNLITLEDSASTAGLSVSVFYPQPPVYNRCFQQAQQVKLFTFQLHNTTPPALHLHYDSFKVGLPERDNFLLCYLKDKEAVEIKINGKNDFSLTGRRQRTYKEQAFIFIELGSFSRCQLLPQDQLPCTKHLPGQRKMIDLRKPLW